VFQEPRVASSDRAQLAGPLPLAQAGPADHSPMTSVIKLNLTNCSTAIRRACRRRKQRVALRALLAHPRCPADEPLAAVSSGIVGDSSFDRLRQTTFPARSRDAMYGSVRAAGSRGGAGGEACPSPADVLLPQLYVDHTASGSGLKCRRLWLQTLNRIFPAHGPAAKPAGRHENPERPKRRGIAGAIARRRR
jgi:hypothetical protein